MTEPKLDLGDTADLIHRVLEKDERAAREFIMRYNRRLYRIARGIVHDEAEAEDVLQESYLRAFSRLESFRGESDLATWLTRIVINEALGRLRRSGKEASDVICTPEDHVAEIISFPTTAPPDPERAVAQKEICELVERAIDALPHDFRIILIARVVEGMSVEEAATAFELQEETVKTRLHRARRMLRDALSEHIEPHLSEAFPFAGERCERISSTVIQRLFGAKTGNL